MRVPMSGPDITQEEIWQDHKDEIQGIVDIKFECEFVNDTNHTIHGELWISKDGYTIKTRDGLRSAHFEHTVAITAEGHIILTQ